MRASDPYWVTYLQVIPSRWSIVSGSNRVVPTDWSVGRIYPVDYPYREIYGKVIPIWWHVGMWSLFADILAGNPFWVIPTEWSTNWWSLQGDLPMRENYGSVIPIGWSMFGDPYWVIFWQVILRGWSTGGLSLQGDLWLRDPYRIIW